MDIFGELLYLLTSRKNQIVVLSKFKIGMLTREIVNVAGKGLSAGDIAQAMAGPARLTCKVPCLSYPKIL